jgi:hypothetical protein
MASFVLVFLARRRPLAMMNASFFARVVFSTVASLEVFRRLISHDTALKI